MGFFDICYLIILSCIPWASLFFLSGPKGSITWFSLTSYWLPGLADIISHLLTSLPPPILSRPRLFKDQCVDKQAWAFPALALCQVRQVCHRARHGGMMSQGKQELGVLRGSSQRVCSPRPWTDWEGSFQVNGQIKREMIKRSLNKDLEPESGEV